MNKNSRSKDIVINNLTATQYTSGLQESYEGEKLDFVDIDAPDRDGFYMNWVVSFEL